MVLMRNASASVAAVETENWVHGEYCLQSFKYFRIAKNKIFDEINDILSEVGPMTLKSIINTSVFEERFFTLSCLNDNIIPEFRVFPFIVAKKVSKGHSNMNLLL